MNEKSAGIRPETHALEVLIKQSIEQGNPCSSSRLFSDNQIVSFPVMVIQDPVLEPVDKLVWMAIHLQVYEGGSDVIFPTYDWVAKMANVSSTSTVSRAINILRLARWLTLYTKHTTNSDACRGVQGNLYILHDEPMPLIDTIYLDPSYQSFLRESTEHHHARVKTVARGILDEVNGNLSTEEQSIENANQEAEHIEKKVLPRYFSYSGKFMNKLRSQPDKDCRDHAAQNLKEAENRVQNLGATTRNTKSSDPQKLNPQKLNPQKLNPGNLKAVRKTRSLIYPRRLSEEQRKVADRLLKQFSVNGRQRLLDEMEGRIRAEQQGMAPLYDELSFLNTLCKAMKKGMFKYNLGIKVHDEREARKRAEMKKRLEADEQSNSQKLAELREEIKAGRGPLAEIRKILKMPNASRTETQSGEY